MSGNNTVIALAGNPNSGKTSLFNFITGSLQHVGNYPGVTVERKEGTVRVDDADLTFVDIPGTYSLNPYSLEEHIAMRELISENISGIIVVVDTTRLSRHLHLVSQVLEIGKPVVIALNMYDEFKNSGNDLNIEQLSEILGVPCVKTVGNRGKGVTELKSSILKAVRSEIPAIGKPFHYSHEMEHAIDAASDIIDGKIPFNDRWSAINLLHFGKSFHENTLFKNITTEDYEKIANIRETLELVEGQDINDIVTSGRYGFTAGVIAECLEEKTHEEVSRSEKIDRIVTHRWLGIPIFFAILWLMFQLTFILGEIPMLWLQLFFDSLKIAAVTVIPDGIVQSLVSDGIIGGVGGVIAFIPNIMLLFFFISLLEDTGYMARGAFIMDRIMHSFGLHGKSFIPMLVGFGCTVPAIMATRTLENNRDRYITMFIIPFMSCGARLPVYILLTGAFFSSQLAGSIIFSIYLFGIIVAFIVAKILSFFQTSSSSFVMELPPYRIPTLRSVLLHIWERAWLYIKKAGTVILTFSIIMWFLMSFPKMPENELRPENVSGSEIGTELSYSFAGRFGKFIEPVLKPLGFDWKIGVALTSGFAAKEVVISSLATIYAIDYDIENKETDQSLKQALRNDASLDPIKAYALMIFILIYVPCFAVLGVLKREAGGWKWVIAMIVYTTSLAWILTFAFVKIANLMI
ncbi:ferrous iron transport protein B [Candidatus Latescibacterota bacterium]